MADPIFADPRLAAVYDAFDGPRDDLAAYVELVTGLLAELGGDAVLDVGCGTGELALRLAARGLSVTGVDPAAASLDVARGKPGAAEVRWVHGEVRDLPAAAYDVAVLAGNVAQVFLGAAWPAVLADLAAAVRPGGWLVLETRRPEARAWEGWAAAPPVVVRRVPGVGEVEQRFALTSVDLPLVGFRWTYRLPGGEVVDSDSTLAFRDRVEVEHDLARAGFETVEVRDAPDRPGLELVFVARRSLGWSAGQRRARAEA